MRTERKYKELEIVEMFGYNQSMAMDVFYNEFSSYLYAICLHYMADNETAKDIFQEVLIRIFVNIKHFKYRKEGSLKAWITRIAINTSLEEVRHSNAITTFLLDRDIVDLPEAEPEVADVREETLLSMIRKLPEGYRTVFNLYVIKGYSHKEIAEMLNIKPDTSASQYHKAKNMLAKMIKDYKTKQRH